MTRFGLTRLTTGSSNTSTAVFLLGDLLNPDPSGIGDSARLSDRMGCELGVLVLGKMGWEREGKGGAVRMSPV